MTIRVKMDNLQCRSYPSTDCQTRPYWGFPERCPPGWRPQDRFHLGPSPAVLQQQEELKQRSATKSNGKGEQEVRTDFRILFAEPSEKRGDTLFNSMVKTKRNRNKASKQTIPLHSVDRIALGCLRCLRDFKRRTVRS